MSEQKDVQPEKEALTPEEVLRTAVSRFNQLEKEVDQAVVREDLATRHQKLVEGAKLVASLPDRIRETLKRGESFPNEELETLERFAELASERLHLAQPAHQKLKAGGDYALSTLLIEHDGRVGGGPNLLEEFVNRLYPPNERQESL